jgi:FlaA1/EpsC-like NDP-sugar epimerase
LANNILKINNFNYRLLAIIHDIAMIPIAWFGAYWLRFNLGSIPSPHYESAIKYLFVVILIQTIAFRYFGLYRGVWRFASIPDLLRIVRSVTIGMAFSAVAIFLISRMEGIPRSVFPVYGLLLISILSGSRLFVRLVKDRRLTTEEAKRVLIVGAGSAGEMLARDLLRNQNENYQPVGFVDDSLKKQGQEIHGVRVLGACNEMTDFVERLGVDFIVLALPSAKASERRSIVEFCEKTGVPFRTLPPLNSLMSGQITINQLREVSINDLLGREQVSLDWDAIRSGIKGKVVLVTGGGGSIGSELCRQIARLDPDSIIIADQSEFNLYTIEKELMERFPSVPFRWHLKDIADSNSVDQLFSETKPDIVFHAAAYKHVPMIEGQLREGVHNNVLGTRLCAAAADRYGCECFVLISTDKAVNPANIMGATKRSAEIFCQNLDQHSSTHYITVRFGNVLDSAGSVVPLFREQIKAGGPVTVTHPEINRYFMTIPEACQLILQAGAMGRGGEIFVLDMGEPVKITYLAEQMIRLSGKIPGEDVDIIYTGLRPGEKLYEELFHEQEQLEQTNHPKIFLARHRVEDWQKLNAVLDQMKIACKQYDEPELKILLNKLVPEWKNKQVDIDIETGNVLTQDVHRSEDVPPLLH